MEIDHLPLPDPIVQAYCRLVDRLLEQRLLALAKTDPAFFRGHRVKRENVHVARNQLKTALRNERQLDPTIKELLAEGSLQRKLVIVLSQAALRKGFADFAAHYGESDFLAAVLLDERQSVRLLAHEFIADRAGREGRESDDAAHSPEDRPGDARARLQASFAPFLTAIAALPGEAEPLAAPAAASAENETLRQALSAAQAALARHEKRAAQEARLLRDEVARHEEEARRQRTRVQALNERLRTLETARADLQREVDSLQAGSAERIRDGVAAAQASTFRHWLGSALGLEQAVEQAARSDLVARAEALLEKQAAADRRYGNRRQLEERRAALQHSLDQLQRAQREALQPLAELPLLIGELQRERHALSLHLGEPEALPEVIIDLLARINCAPTLDELYGVRRFIQQAALLGVVASGELRRLFRAADARAGLIYDRSSLEEQFARPSDPAASQLARLHFSLAIRAGEQFLLMLDGHNLLFTLSDTFAAHYVDGYPSSQARSELVSRLQRIFVMPGADVLLYFDGPRRGEESLSEQLRVVYSGGEGENRADQRMLSDLEFHRRRNPALKRRLVTRDADLARQAQDLGAAAMDPEELAALLEAYASPR